MNDYPLFVTVNVSIGVLLILSSLPNASDTDIRTSTYNDIKKDEFFPFDAIFMLYSY